MAWNGDDYIGALIMRDAIEAAISKLSPASRQKVDAWLTDVDDHFRRITEALGDPDSLRRHAAAEDLHPSPGWWWTHSPTRGPVKRDLGWRVRPQ